MTEEISVPDVLLQNVMNEKVSAEITANEFGVICGVEELCNQAVKLGLKIEVFVNTGDSISKGQRIVRLSGNPLQIVKGEDFLLGAISKASGVATAARKAALLSGPLTVVSGGWKKMPLQFKEELRNAVKVGGVGLRILPHPFIYLDKNYLRIFGSYKTALETVQQAFCRSIVVQVRGETGPVGEEAVTAAQLGAEVLMVDTGELSHVRLCSARLKAQGLRSKVKLAFAGGLKIDDLPYLQTEDIDIVDIGRPILDAPILDFRYDVINRCAPVP